MKNFRIVAYLEGISLVVLMGIAIPMKYVWGQPQMVKAVGWVHGILFIAYVCLMASVSAEEKWSNKNKLWAVIAAMLPFGTFVFDRKCLSTRSRP